MQRKRKENGKSSAVKDFVTVAFAEDMELARQYKELLEDNQIEVQVKRQADMAESGFSDIAIAVPEESLDEAHHLIADRASYNDFFDMTFDDECQRPDVYEFEVDEDDDLY